MPYSGISDPALPKNVRSLSPVRKRQWLHIFNSEKANGASDADAIIRANGVIKKQMGRSMAAGKSDAEFSTDMPIVLGLEGIFEGEIDAGLEENLLRIEAGQECGGTDAADWVNKVTQEEANYQVLGGTSDRACANCRWFLMNAHACQVVGGTIYHTGVSDRYEAVPVSEPYVQPVTIVDSSTDPQAETSSNERGGIGKLARNAYESILGFLGLESNISMAPKDTTGSSISLHEGTGDEPGPLYTPPGRLRYWAVATNSVDGDNKGLGFPAAAHEDYVDWVWQKPEERMPELQIWHTPGTRLGQADWIDFDGHFRHSTGLIDAGREELARDLASDPEMAMSHGYVVVWDRHKRAKSYRSYEESVLPRQYAGNSFTSFGLEEGDVAFTDARKKFLRERGGVKAEADLAARENRWDQFQQLLDGLGIGFHELELFVDSTRYEQGLADGDADDAEQTQSAAPATTPAVAAAQPAGDQQPAAQSAAAAQASSESTQLATEGMTAETLVAMLSSMMDTKLDTKLAPFAQAVHGLQEHQNRVEQLLPNARPTQPVGYDATKGANNTPTLIQTPTGGVALGQQSKEGVPAEPLPPAVLAAIAAGAQENGGSLESPIAWLQKKLEGGHPLLNGTAPEVRG